MITVALIDDLDDPVAGATVEVTINTTTGSTWTPTGTTGSDGKVTYKLTNAPSGIYTTAVTSVSATGLSWDTKTPPNSFEK